MLQAFAAGRLGRDAEIKDFNGSQVVNFTLAINQYVRKERVTTWVSCQYWGARAVGVAPYLNKGGCVSVQGELTTREYEGKTYLEMRVNDLTLQSSPGETSHAPQQQTYAAPQAPHQPQAPQGTYQANVPQQAVVPKQGQGSPWPVAPQTQAPVMPQAPQQPMQQQPSVPYDDDIPF